MDFQPGKLYRVARSTGIWLYEERDSGHADWLVNPGTVMMFLEKRECGQKGDFCFLLKDQLLFLCSAEEKDFTSCFEGPL